MNNKELLKAILEKAENIENFLKSKECDHMNFVRAAALANLTHCPDCGKSMVDERLF